MLILRDPFNLFASRWRSIHPEIGDAAALRMWKQHARAALNPRKGLQHDPVVVLYNNWFLDSDYRRQLADRLALPFSDAGLQRVSHCGGGSSFDARRYDGRAQQMPVLQRWQAYADDPRFRTLFDAQTLDLAEQLFDLDALPDLREWLDGVAVG